MSSWGNRWGLAWGASWGSVGVAVTGVGATSGVGSVTAVHGQALSGVAATAGVGNASVPLPTHRYWRLDFTHSYYIAIAEIEMHTTVGGADACSGGTAGSSGSFGGNVAASAFDNNNATFFESAGATGPFYVSYDFGAGNEKQILEVSFTSNPTYSAEHPQKVGVSYSDDGSSWTVAMPLKACETWSSTQVTATYRLSGADATSYWRINASGSALGSYCEISELELRVGGVDQTAPGGPAKADTVFSTSYAALAFDNSTTTVWGSNSGFPHWLYYRFPVDTAITEYVITSGPSLGSHNGYAPNAWTLEYSGDGVTWTTADTQSGIAAWGDQESRTYTLAGAGVTLALTGVAASGAPGTLTPVHSAALSGTESTASVGTLVAADAPTLSGLALTGAAGNLGTSTLTLGLSGVATSATAGSVVASPSRALTGVAATSGLGALVVLPTGPRKSRKIDEVHATAGRGSVGVTHTVALTGVTASLSAGNLVVVGAGNVVVALTGVQATRGIGSVGVTRSRALTGAASSAAVGTLGTARSRALSGTQASGVLNTFGADHEQDLTLVPTGNVATGGVGTLGRSIEVGLVGVQSVADPGTLLFVEPPDIAVELSGVAGSAEVGTLAPDSAVPLTGEDLVGAVGDVAAEIELALSGAESSAEVATLDWTLDFPDDVEIELVGVEAAASAGRIGILGFDTLIGAQGAGALGEVTPERDTALSGSEGLAEAGNVTAGIVVGLSGVELSATPGTLGSTREVEVTGLAATGGAGGLALGLGLVGLESAGAVGTLAPESDAELSGVAATLDPGTLLPDTQTALAGVATIAVVGDVGADLAPPLTGAAADAGTGELTTDRTVALSGVQGQGRAGFLPVFPDRISELTGVEATGEVGSLEFQPEAHGVAAQAQAGALGPSLVIRLSGVQGGFTLGAVEPVIRTGPLIEMRALAFTLAPSLAGQVVLTPRDATPLDTAGITLAPRLSARAALRPALHGTPDLTEADVALMD